MDHEEAKLRLSDLVEGRLHGDVETTAEAHVVSCDDCRTWIETYRIVSEGLGETASDPGGDHPPSNEIAVFAIEAERLDPRDLALVSTHVRECRDCSNELAATRGAVGIREPSRGRFSRTHPGFVAALAAGVVLAVLAYPAFLGLHRLPVATDRTDALEQELERRTSWSGPVGYLILSTGTRGETEIPTLKLRGGQPFVSLAVLPELPATIAPEDAMRFEIRAENETVVWQAEMSAAEIEADLASFEVVFFQMPSRMLPPAGYELRLFDAGAPDELLLQARFSIEPAD